MHDDPLGPARGFIVGCACSLLLLAVLVAAVYVALVMTHLITWNLR